MIARPRMRDRALAEALAEERRRFARDLHDGMAQDLAFIVQHGSELAARPGADAGLADIVTAARRALDDARDAITALVRPVDEPFAHALARAAAEVADREGITVRIELGHELELPAPARASLLRIVREAITNAARHGRAQIVSVSLGPRPGDGLQCNIADDGVGFDPASLDDGSDRRGIAGMRERAVALGGTLSIRSRPGVGSEVGVILP